MAAAKRIRKFEFRTTRAIQGNRKAIARAFDSVAKDINKVMKKHLGKRGRRRRVGVPAVRSLPGEAPRKQTGNLQRETTVKREGFKLVVRSPQYGIWLHQGTTNIAPRNVYGPILRRKKFWTRRIASLAKKFSKIT